MNRLLLTVLLTSISTVALAQAPAQRKFVPFTVDEKAAQELQNWLNEQPFKFSAPVLQWLATQEQVALDAAAKAAAPAAPEPPK